MRLGSAILAFLLITSDATTARPAGKSTNRKVMEKEARKACITGDVRKGIDLLGDLFVETRDINYVYNQGRCFEQNHRWEEALDRFREYLRKSPHLSATEKVDVETHILECETEQAKLVPPPPAPIAPPPPAPAPTLLPASAATVTLAAPLAVAEPHSATGLRTAGIVTAAVGLAALTGGLVFNILGNSLTNELGKNWDRDKASRRDSYETLGWVGYGVGAAALVTGTTLMIVGGGSIQPARTVPAVSLTPVMCPGFAALSLRGSY